MEYKKIDNFGQKIEGWLTKKESKLLYELSNNYNGKGAIVEIGSWKGKSTIYLAWGSKKGKKNKVYAIDPHSGSLEHKEELGKVWTFEDFKKNIKKGKVNDIISPIVNTSENASKEFKKKVGILFIDGSHEYKDVKNDFKNWFNKIENNGIIAFHDVFNVFFNGPTFFLMKEILTNKKIYDLKFVDSIMFLKKSEKKITFNQYKQNIFLFFKKCLKEIKYFLNLKRIPLNLRYKIRKIIKK